MIAAAQATAYWSLPDLLTRLAARSWGPILDGHSNRGLKVTLEALAEKLPRDTAQGFATVQDIATRATYTVKWTSRCLRRLEELGIISWRRGYMVGGIGRPGWIRVHKAVLAQLGNDALAYSDAKRAQHRAAKAERLSKLRLANPTLLGKTRYNPLSALWEVTSPHVMTEVSRRSAGHTTAPPNPPGAQETMPRCTECGLTEIKCRELSKKSPYAARHRWSPPGARATKGPSMPWRMRIPPGQPTLEL